MPLDRARAADASPPSVGELFALHAPFVWNLLRRLGVPEADAEDVCQEVFLIAHRKLPEFEPRAAPRTWLYGIALRAASDFRRRAHVRREELTATPPDQPVAEAQDRELERRRRLAWLDAILDELDQDKRAVFVLYEIEQLSMPEVVTILGCPLQTAYSRLHAARKHVREAARARSER